MTNLAIAYLAACAVVGAAAVAWAVHLYRVERDAPSQTERLLGGAR